MTTWEDALKRYPLLSIEGGEHYAGGDRIDYLQSVALARLAYALCRIADALETKPNAQMILNRKKMEEKAEKESEES